MVLIVHGFPNQISALRFEWAWQNPKTSRRLKHLPSKRAKEKQFEYRFRILCNMLRTGPWDRLPLTIRWLKQEYRQDFPPDLTPPTHMPVAFGLVKAKRVTATQTAGSTSAPNATEEDDMLPLSQVVGPRCSVCAKKTKSESNVLRCVAPQCTAVAHTLCLSKRFLESEPDTFVPVKGFCPMCKNLVLWGDLMRLKAGCYQALEEVGSADSDDHWTDQLQT